MDKECEGSLTMPKSSGFLNNQFSTNLLLGATLIFSGLVLFLVFLFAAIISKLLPPFDNKLLSAIQIDRYYCLLVPLTLPVLLVAVYFHWLSMKLFKHA